MKAALVLAAACAALAAAPGQAATITVGGGCSIVDAVRAANTNTARGGCPAGDPNFNVRDTVVLEPGATYTFTAPYAPEVGPAPEATALPHLASVITIEGNGAVLQRSDAAGTPRFRLLRALNGNVIVNDVTLRGGDQTTNGGVGGGMYASAAFVTLNGVTIEDNSADSGGGLAGTAPFTLNHLTVRRNRAELIRGGGLLLLNPSTVRDSTIVDNTAASFGGGISSELSSSQLLTVLRTTVSGNEAGYGGGIYTSGAATIANSTISGNRALDGFFGQYGGAGIHANFTGSSVVQLTNSTVAGNRSDFAGETGGILSNGAAVRLANSIVIGNESAASPTATVSDCKAFSGGSILSDGSNLFGLGTGCGLTGSDRGADGGQAFTAVLRPLAVNPPGGMETHRLWKHSPALDGGSNAICNSDPIDGIDQRGVSRVENAPCDIGAYEAQRADLELTSPTSVGRPPLGSDVPLTLTLRNAGPSHATGVTVRAPIPEGLRLVSADSDYDPATGLWSVGSLAANATASLRIVVRVDRYAVYRAEVFSFDQEDPDSTPANEIAGEDDLVRLAITPPGIWVNTTLEAAQDDGLCNIVEAVFSAESDTAPFATPGECTAGSGADTIHLQPGAKYISTDVWLSGDAFPSITSAITIEGNGASIERGATPKYFRAVQVYGGGSLTLRNLGMHFFETRDEACGGAIHLFFGSLILDNVFLSQNRVRDAYMGGGAICNVHGTLTATNSRIEDNTVDVSESFLPARGGGITTNGEPAVTTLTNTSVRNNVVTSSALASGGGLEVVNGATLNLTRGSVRQNRIHLTGLTSQAFGGGISAEGDAEPAEVRITGTTVTENRVDAVGDNREALGGGLSLRYASGNLVDAAVGDLNSGFGNRAVGGGGGIYVADDADLGMTRGIVSGNTATAGRGGGGILSDGGLVDLRNVELAGNSSDGLFGSGGAIKTSGRLLMADATIWSNFAPSGAGITNFFGSVEIKRSLITQNEARVGGGALDVGGGPGTLVVEDSTISDNRAGRMGGAIWTGLSTVLTDTVVSGNRLTIENCEDGCPKGAGIYATKQLRLIRGEVESNVAPGQSLGGGVWSENTVLADDVRVSQNAARIGGGFYMTGGRLEANQTTVELNQAYEGGGIFQFEGSTLLRRSLVDGNRASSHGGGIAFTESDVVLTNTTLSRNTADLGGAVYHGYDAALNIFSSTITANDALKTGGIYSERPDGGTIRASIVAGNQSQDSGDPDCDADSGSTPASEGSNVFASGGGCQLRNDLGDRGVFADTVANEVVFPLADNDGPTLTHALRPSSPAIDLVGPTSCDTNDQRLLPRPKDGDGDGQARCDSGAFEAQTVHLGPLAVVGLSPSSVPANGGPSLLVLTGQGFPFDSRARLDGVPKSTEYIGSSRLFVRLQPSDLQTTEDITTVAVTVERPDGSVSNPIPLLILGPRIASANSATAVPGASATSATAPAAPGQAGVSATLTNNGGGAAMVTTARYGSNPVGGTTFDGGGYTDVQVKGADANDRLDARFYYPNTVTGKPEANLQLRYWTGSKWAAVKGQGGAGPVKNKTDNLDGTVSGGRFTVTFGNTSTPKITELGGTVLGTDLDGSPPVTTATVSPAAGASGWHAGDVTVTLDATDDDSGVSSIEWALDGGAFGAYTGPIAVVAEGVHTLRHRSTDGAENAEPEATLDIRIDRTAPVATVAALPAETTTRTFAVNWAGTDALSGVASYDLYVSVDGGGLMRWKTGTTGTSALYAGAAGHRYAFAAAARDVAGNSEALPVVPEASVRVVSAPQTTPKPKPKKVTLCHRGRTIKVSKSAVKKHRKHGDKLGACKKPKRKPRR